MHNLANLQTILMLLPPPPPGEHIMNDHYPHPPV